MYRNTSTGRSPSATRTAGQAPVAGSHVRQATDANAPCPACHGTDGYTSTGTCTACHATTQAQAAGTTPSPRPPAKPQAACVKAAPAPTSTPCPACRTVVSTYTLRPDGGCSRRTCVARRAAQAANVRETQAASPSPAPAPACGFCQAPLAAADAGTQAAPPGGRPIVPEITRKGDGAQPDTTTSTSTAHTQEMAVTATTRCPHHRPARQCRFCLAELKAQYAAGSDVTPVATPPEARHHAVNPDHQAADWAEHHPQDVTVAVAYADRVKPLLPVEYVCTSRHAPHCTDSPRRGDELAGAQGQAYQELAATATDDEVLSRLRYSNLRLSTKSMAGAAHYAPTVNAAKAASLVRSGLARIEYSHRTGRHRRSVVLDVAVRVETRGIYTEPNQHTDHSPAEEQLAALVASQKADAKHDLRRVKRGAEQSTGFTVEMTERRTADHSLERWLVITEAGRRHVDALDAQRLSQAQREEQTAVARAVGKSNTLGYTAEQCKALDRLDLGTEAGRFNWANMSTSAITRLCRLMGRDWLPAKVAIPGTRKQRGESATEHAARVEALLGCYHLARARGAVTLREAMTPPAAPSPMPRPEAAFVPAPNPGPGLASAARLAKEDEPQVGPSEDGTPGPSRVVMVRGLRPDTVLPVVPAAREVTPLGWTLEAKGGRFGLSFTRDDGTEGFMALGYRRMVTAVAWGDLRSGMADWWRLAQLERKDGSRSDLTLSFSHSGEPATWTRDRAMTEAEAVAWLDGRSGGQGARWLAAMLGS